MRRARGKDRRVPPAIESRTESSLRAVPSSTVGLQPSSSRGRHVLPQPAENVLQLFMAVDPVTAYDVELALDPGTSPSNDCRGRHGKTFPNGHCVAGVAGGKACVLSPRAILLRAKIVVQALATQLKHGALARSAVALRRPIVLPVRTVPGEEEARLVPLAIEAKRGLI